MWTVIKIAVLIKRTAIIVVILIKIQKHDIFVRTVSPSPNKEDSNHDRSPIKTHNQVIFVKRELRSWSQSYKDSETCTNKEDCDHDRSPQK